ncbi:lipoic acid synthetase [Gracilaria domingensis]|nr:lipoic acid synthetase [Gracilaria domingensis]
MRTCGWRAVVEAQNAYCFKVSSNAMRRCGRGRKTNRLRLRRRASNARAAATVMRSGSAPTWPACPSRAATAVAPSPHCARERPSRTPPANAPRFRLHESRPPDTPPEALVGLA